MDEQQGETLAGILRAQRRDSLRRGSAGPACSHQRELNAQHEWLHIENGKWLRVPEPLVGIAPHVALKNRIDEELRTLAFPKTEWTLNALIRALLECGYLKHVNESSDDVACFIEECGPSLSRDGSHVLVHVATLMGLFHEGWDTLRVGDMRLKLPQGRTDYPALYSVNDRAQLKATADPSVQPVLTDLQTRTDNIYSLYTPDGAQTLKAQLIERWNGNWRCGLFEGSTHYLFHSWAGS